MNIGPWSDHISKQLQRTTPLQSLQEKKKKQEDELQQKRLRESFGCSVPPSVMKKQKNQLAKEESDLLAKLADIQKKKEEIYLKSQ